MGGGLERNEMRRDARVGVLRNGRVEDKDPHGALGPVDGGGHICVGFFDQHDGGLVEEER